MKIMGKIILCVFLLTGCLPLCSAKAQQTIGPAQVQQAENQLTQVYQQLMGRLSPADQQKLKQSEIQWIKNKQVAINANPQNANLLQYQIVMDRVRYLSGFLNGSVQQQSQPSHPPTVSQPQSAKAGITSQRSDRIDGINVEKEKWAYEFLDNNNSSKSTIFDLGMGFTVFENPEWIVRASEKDGNVGKVQTDLFFFDARTLGLVATCRIPNRIVSVGKTKKTFFVLTITPGKYRFDDVPLALTLIQPRERNIDRVVLVSDEGLNYWFALRNPIQVENKNDSIVILYDPSAKSSTGTDEYILTKTKNRAFEGIRIAYQPERNAQLLNARWNDYGTHGGGRIERINYANHESAGLAIAGINDVSGETTRTNTTGLSISIVDQGSQKGTHVNRVSKTAIIDLNLDDLNIRSFSPGGGLLRQIGIFRNGAIFSEDQVGLSIFSKSGSKRITGRDGKFLFGQDAAYFLMTNASSTNPENFLIQKISSEGQQQKITLPTSPLDPDSSGESIYNPCSAPAKATETILNYTPKGSVSKEVPVSPRLKRVDLHPETDCIYTYKNGDSSGGQEIPHVIGKYRFSDGKILWRHTQDLIRGKIGWPTEVLEGNAPAGWHIFSECTGASTGGADYGIVVQHDNGSPEVLLDGSLPADSSPLEMRLKEDGSMQILFSCAGVTKLAEYTPDGKLKTTLAEWKSPPQEGKPLLLSEKNLIFIPKAGGYDAYRIFGESKPEKAFEIYFRGSSDYVILLPNGFYAGSPGCEKLIKIPSSGSLVDATSLAPWKNRPAEVIKALGGDPKTADLLGKVTDRWLKRIGFDPSTPEPAASEIAKVSVPQMPPLWATSSSVSFPIEVTAGGEPLKEVAVRVNGVLQKSFSGSELNVPSRGHTTLNASVTLAEGQNWIEVTATDAKGRPGNLEHFRTILPKASETPKRYIVAMGCSEYDRPELNLQFAAKDAGDVLKTFSEAGGRECKTLLLTNKEVGPEALEKIKVFVAESKESDEVILFCAGHGLLDEHLDYVYAGHQIDPEHPGQTGVKLDSLLNAIGSGKSLKRLVLMDTCQSGAVGEKEEMKLAEASTELPHGVRAIKSRALKVVGTASLAGEDQQRFIEEMFLLPGQHRGINIIGASGGAEYAMESDKWNNGVFTSALIEAMRDQKADMDHRGRISVSDLKTYLAQRVPELTGGAQKPSVVAFEQDQDFDLVGNMPPIPESVKNNTGATASEVPTPSASGATVSESSSVAQPNLGSQFVNSLGQKFVPIPGTPAYFCIWDTRVSDYGRFVQETGRAWKPAGFPQKPDHPAVRINYNDATAFCEWLTKKEHASGTLPQNCEYRLPKDLEWSAAAGITSKEIDGPPAWRSGGIPNCYAWGSSWPPPKGSGNYDPKMKTDSFANTSPVGSFAPNKIGLYDMNGNVYQWTLEAFDESGQGCLRGGSWPDEQEESINLSNRFPAAKDSAFKCYGFRCVIAPSTQK